MLHPAHAFFDWATSLLLHHARGHSRYVLRMNTGSLTLYYAPDNASLVVRLALEHLKLPYRTHLVDRQTSAQRTAAYLKINPNGLIPTLDTPEGPIFETAAILLWLSDRHPGLAPNTQSSERGDFLKWLFFLSNTLHPTLRQLFYTETFVGPDRDAQTALRQNAQQAACDSLEKLNARWTLDHVPLALSLYLCPMVRWLALYPVDQDKSWFDLTRYPAIHACAEKLQTLDATRAAQRAEGLGPNPFTAPRPPMPPEGSAL